MYSCHKQVYILIHFLKYTFRYWGMEEFVENEVEWAGKAETR